MLQRSLGELTFYIYWNEVIASLFKRSQNFFSGAVRKRFYVGRYCKYKEWVSYFPAFMGNELGWGSDKSSENRFADHGICHVPRLSSFPMNAEKRHSFLNWTVWFLEQRYRSNVISHRSNAWICSYKSYMTTIEIYYKICSLPLPNSIITRQWPEQAREIFQYHICAILVISCSDSIIEVNL